MIICNRCNANFEEEKISVEQLQKTLDGMQFSHKITKVICMYRANKMSLLPCGHLDSHWRKINVTNSP